MERGQKEGRKEGREEVKLLIAKNLLKKGSTPEFVNEVTGLPPEKIKKL
jgi:predicted transposase/invertase (TIGR01784 family)